MKEYNVFISYSRKDDTGPSSPIEIILRRFEEEGIKPWIDREGKYCGAPFQKEILRALDNSELLLFISSVNSNNDRAKWVFREVNYADEKKMKIVPLLLDSTPFNEEIKLIFSGKDRNEYFKNSVKGLDDIIGSIKKYLNDVKKKEKERELAEEAERRRMEEEYKRLRQETEEKKRIERLEKEIASIKKRIVDYVDKQQACMKALLLKEKDLNKSGDISKECPICRSSLLDSRADYCDICGWHFATPKELFSPKMQRMYEERLHSSQIIWEEKQQRKEEIELLIKEKGDLIARHTLLQTELNDIRNKYNKSLQDHQKQVQMKDSEISKLKSEILSHNKEKIDGCPISFLIVTEFDNENVYSLYEGRNIFGSMQVGKSIDYQMLVVSENKVKPQHFEIKIIREGRSFKFYVSPIDSSYDLAINSSSNKIERESRIDINDILFIGNVKIQIVDNFNKRI